ncbi:MaoC/PaaZ C-terminal domain-containing protein [Rhodococcus opacus]|jgi:acyl dehydratase|uniref:MaoC like domain protein n=3 Tax=Nocardiaceae TaxID=85025 RepID=A0A1B1KEH2_RHOOP|nr:MULTISPECIES: MaoC/PaaZ C-terminal domain-containing protein [Rhodococcus]EKT81950.1 acyl dehydratase [Rhodococcus opacus M213]ELB87535.1 acyl dehydratase [Rhodococcus wratislaviensis IFP 2016]NDV09631.1 dehydratase [Rhodococcus sp. IEGM 248]NHU49116.1 dehydratase [Rhodococcus sp. A14]QSE84650.1 MaoC family dehydratase N-terminal domain-containing protein [Rhodococcus koreensis]
MAGLWFDDVEIGMTFETPRRTVTEADVVNFAGVSGDFHTLHTDAQTMRESQFGERIAHGALVLSIVTGLRGRLGIFDDTLVAFAEIRRWRFVRPVLIGDTIRAANEVVELTPTSKPDRGVMVQHVQVLNQHDVVVQEGEMVALVKREAKV